MRTSLFVALLLFGVVPAWAAEEPSGCDKFKWPIERERAALTAPDRSKLASGGELTALPSTGVTLALRAPAATPVRGGRFRLACSQRRRLAPGARPRRRRR